MSNNQNALRIPETLRKVKNIVRFVWYPKARRFNITLSFGDGGKVAL